MPERKSDCDENISVTESETTSPDSGVKNLRTLCGCFLIFTAIILLAIFYPFKMAFDSAGNLRQEAKTAVSSAWQQCIAIWKEKPTAIISSGAEFVSSESVNKYIIAEVKEKIPVHKEADKFKIMSGSLDLEIIATYQYYIPLRGIKYYSRTSLDDGKYYFLFLFDSLACDNPVKYEIPKKKTIQSKFSDDVNKSLDDYIVSELPPALMQRARGYINMKEAIDKAADSMRHYIIKNIFPTMGVSEKEVGDIKIIFDTDDFNGIPKDVKIFEDKK